MNPSNQGNSSQNQGASNANDFQPTTQNPQNIEADLFQQQGSLQETTNGQELLSDNQNTTLYVNNTPINNTTSTQVNNGSGIDWVLIVIVIASLLLIASIILRFRLKKITYRTAPTEVTENPAEVAPKPHSTKVAAKKKSYKKKRRNR
jgi:hypothetical protein